MTMAINSLFSLNFTGKPSSIPVTGHPFLLNSLLPSGYLQCRIRKRELSLPLVASIPYQPVNVDYLQDEFGGHGVTFEGLGDVCIAKMGLANGSTATLMLPSGLITSYKPRMWHGGTLELLQTSVSEGKEGTAVIQGGVSLAFDFECDDDTSWFPSNWSLRDVRGNSHDSIQVELIGNDTKDMVGVKYIISLKEDTLSSELVVSNSTSSPIMLSGSLVSHITVSSPEATYAYGLEGSNIFNRPIFLSNFSIVPAGLENVFVSDQPRSEVAFKGILTGQGVNLKVVPKGKGQRPENMEILEEEEDDNYKNLTEKMSRIYTNAPRDFTVIDRGRRNSIAIIREGFRELYIFSPGSDYESYSKYSYVCIGQSAMLESVTIGPNETWRGGQHLHNPNL